MIAFCWETCKFLNFRSVSPGRQTLGCWHSESRTGEITGIFLLAVQILTKPFFFLFSIPLFPPPTVPDVVASQASLVQICT